MHNSLKLFKKVPIFSFGLICLALTCGCGNRITTRTIDKSYETDTVFVDAKIPQFYGFSSKSMEAALNEEIESLVSSHLSAFNKDAKKTGDKSQFTLEVIEHYNKNNFFSAVIQINTNVGSSKKNSFRITKNIDTKNCLPLNFCDLFEDDSYIDMINARLMEFVEKNPEKYTGLWEKPQIITNQPFYIDRENIVLFYPPYELSYYERGFVEIPLPAEDMSGYLKPEYRRLCGGGEAETQATGISPENDLIK